jgi:hypothetical protein
MSESTRPKPTAFTARSPVDLVAAVPYVLGFHPEDSVVLMTFGPGETFHARVALPDDEDDQLEVVDMLTDVVARHGVGRVALLLYTEDPWVAATFHDAVVPPLVQAGVDVIDVLRVGRDRFHSACDIDDPGTAYDLKAHPFTAEQVLEGKVVHSSREQLAASLDVVDAADARAVAEAALRFDEQFSGLPAFVAVDRITREVADHARWMQRTIRRHVRRGAPLTADDAGRLLVLVAAVPLRDVAWAEIDRAGSGRHVELWRDLVRRCPHDLLPSASSLLAFAAWLHGDGALAWCALDRCHEVDPDYSMAACISGLLAQAVPPTVWRPIEESELPVLWPPDVAS